MALCSDENITLIEKTWSKPTPFRTQMGDENGFQVGMGIGMTIAFEDGYGYG